MKVDFCPKGNINILKVNLIRSSVQSEHAIVLIPVYVILRILE